VSILNAKDALSSQRALTLSFNLEGAGKQEINDDF